MWNTKRNDTKELTCKTERDPQSMVTVGGGVVADLRKVMYALLCLEWIINGNLHGPLPNVMCQAGWDSGLAENGYMFRYD